MSRLQWLVVFLLGALIACVFGCLVLVLLVPDLRPSQNARQTTSFVATAVPATDIPVVPATSAPIAADSTVTSLPASPTAKPSPTKKSQAAPHIEFQVRQFSTYESSFGALYFIGDAINKSDVRVCCVQIVISLLDEAGNVLAASNIHPSSLCEIEIGQRYPFLMQVSDKPIKYASAKFQIQASPAPSIVPCYRQFKVDKITEHLPSSASDTFGLSGQVTNMGDATAGPVLIIAIAYDANDNVIDEGYDFAKITPLAPQNDSPFELQFRRLKQRPARYEIFAQGYRD